MRNCASGNLQIPGSMRSLSSGAHSRDPLASLRNDVMVFRANFLEAAASWLPPFVCRYRLAILAGAASLRQTCGQQGDSVLPIWKS